MHMLLSRPISLMFRFGFCYLFQLVWIWNQTPPPFSLFSILKFWNWLCWKQILPSRLSWNLQNRAGGWLFGWSFSVLPNLLPKIFSTKFNHIKILLQMQQQHYTWFIGCIWGFGHSSRGRESSEQYRLDWQCCTVMAFFLGS